MVRRHRQFEDVSTDSIRSTLSRLKKKKLAVKTSAGWSASNLALATLGSRSDFNKISRQATKNNQKGKSRGKEVDEDRMIVMYDIPEKLRSKRDRLRDGLKILGFKQKQQSVWIGPAPLPREFVEFLGELRILKYINFFQVKSEDIV